LNLPLEAIQELPKINCTVARRPSSIAGGKRRKSGDDSFHFIFIFTSHIDRIADKDSSERWQSGSKMIHDRFRHLLKQEGEIVSTEEGMQID
jgi:hypothetical protein